MSAITPDLRTAGPPGVALDLAGTGYGACDTVYFFFDNLRIGSAKPDANGAVDRGGLSVPGQASTGTHTVTSSCERTGENVVTSTTFDVRAAELHRPALMSSLPQPRDITLDPQRLALSGVVAAGFILLIAFPAQLFNSTLEENYAEVRGWFGLPPQRLDRQPRYPHLMLLLFVVSGGICYAALSRDFGFNRTTLVIVLGLNIAILITGLGFALPGVLYMRRRFGERGRVRVFIGTIILAILTVGISRAVGFDSPGYVYGLLGVVVFKHELDKRREGHLTTITSVFVLAVSLGAWFLRTPVSSVAAGDHPPMWALVLELVLGGIFLMGLENLVVDLFPLRYLDGDRIKTWSKFVWVALFGVALFLVVHVLLSPGSGYVGDDKDLGLEPVVIGMYLAFFALSVSFWGYFRFRTAREVSVG